MSAPSSSTEPEKNTPKPEDVAMDTTPDETQPVEETWDDVPEDIKSLSADEINSRIRLIDNDIKVCVRPLR